MGNIIRHPVIKSIDVEKVEDASAEFVDEILLSTQLMAKKETNKKIDFINELQLAKVKKEREDILLEQAKLKLQQENKLIQDKAVKQGYEKGYQEGIQKGIQVAQSQRDQEILNFQQLGENLTNEIKKIPQLLEKSLLPLMFAVLSKLFGDRAISDQLVIAVVKQTLSGVDLKQQIILKLHPNDAQLFLAQDKELELNKNITITEDHQIKGGGCVIETVQGDVDAQLIVQLDVLKGLLSERYFQ